MDEFDQEVAVARTTQVESPIQFMEAPVKAKADPVADPIPSKMMFFGLESPPPLPSANVEQV